MKQNPSEANRVLVLLLAFALFLTGCVKRTLEVSTVNAEPSAVRVRKININNASVAELESLPGIGRVMAERIVEHRAHHGPFRRIEHLMLVRGISESKFIEIEHLITVN